MILQRGVERMQIFFFSARAISSCFRKKRFISIHQVDAGQWHFCLNVLKKIMNRNQPYPGIIKQTGFKNQLDFKKIICKYGGQPQRLGKTKYNKNDMRHLECYWHTQVFFFTDPYFRAYLMMVRRVDLLFLVYINKYVCLFS